MESKRITKGQVIIASTGGEDEMEFEYYTYNSKGEPEYSSDRGCTYLRRGDAMEAMLDYVGAYNIIL